MSPPPSGPRDEPGDAGASARLRRVEAVFFEVSTLAPVDRDAAIARLCAGDADLEGEVRSLIASAARIGSFLEQPALGTSVEHLEREAREGERDDLVGATLGAFILEARLASGGMGTVYRATRRDGQFQQRVAIKVVKRGMDSDEILRRFRDERQTLAALDHPHIARLLDGGVTPDGRPFLVMEYVDGVPIDEYCDQHRLGVRERLRLFQRACEGVHHAHKNLVIHRDLKPSNILVTPDGTPKLLDFGIAKVIAGTGGPLGATMTSGTERRLTPEYASPEQVEGERITTASDVYALGVVLYELLTGVRPYALPLRTQDELRRIVCELDPPPPSAAVTVRAGRLASRTGTGSPASLPTPTPRAAPGGPSERETVPAPAIDVPRTRGMTSTRLRGLLRGDLDNVVMMALRKEPGRRYAGAEQFAADIGRYLDGLPVQARRDTLGYRASKFVRRHVVAVSLTGLAVALLATATIVLARQRAEIARQRDALIAGNARLDDARRFLATVLSGASTGNQGPDARVGDLLRDAVQELEADPPADPLTRAFTEQSIGQAVMSMGDLERGEALLRSAARALAALPEDDEARLDIDLDLAQLEFFKGRGANAEAALRGLLSRERSRARAASASGPTAREGQIVNDLGAALRAQGRLDEARTAQQEAVAIRSAVHGPQSLEVAESRNNLASVLVQQGDLTGGVRLFREVLAAREARLRPHHPLVLRTRSNLGLALVRSGDPGSAERELTIAVDEWPAAFGPDHPGIVAARISLAQAQRTLGRTSDALTTLAAARAWQEAHPGVPQGSVPALAATDAHVGATLAAAGREAEARVLLERVVPVLREGGSGYAGALKAAEAALREITERAKQVPATPPAP